MAGAVEHDDGHVADAAALALGDQLQRLRQRPVEVEQVGDLLAAGHLFHVDAGAGVEHRAALGERDHREGAGHAAARRGGVPSSGSTAMSTTGGLPSPICSPL